MKRVKAISWIHLKKMKKKKLKEKINDGMQELRNM